MPKVKTSKEELIKSSLETFKMHGFPATSMSMLAKAAGVEKAHLYYYFKNKEDLMLEVLLYLNQYTSKYILSIAYQEELSSSERINQLLTKLKKFYKEYKLGCLMTNTVLQTLYEKDIFSNVAKKFCDDLIAAVAHLYEDRYSPKYALGKAKQAVQDMYGGMIFTQIYKDEKFLDDAIARISKKL